MHIAIVTCFSKDPKHIEGGVAGVGKYLADELAKNKDIDLSIVVPKANLGETICIEWPGYKVYRVGIKRIWSFLPGIIYDILIGRRKLNAVLRQINPDLVHYQGYCFLSANCEFPAILTVHGIAEHEALLNSTGVRRIIRWLFLKLAEDYGRRKAKNIIWISEYGRKLLQKKIKPEKTWLIENPVANSYFDVERKFQHGRIFYCSWLTPLKNILGMITAFKEIVKTFPHTELRIAGSGPPDYLAKCKKTVRESNLQDRVLFLGFLNIKAVQDELSKAHCLTLLSFQENAPLIIEEAMAVGVPVVGAKVGGIAGMVEDGKTGFLVDPYNTKSIYEAVSKILSDEALTQSMGHRAKEAAKKRFMASTISEKTLKVYHTVLSEKT
jgi:glycosyltransferase involved in cell wall biosynthesis